MEKINIAEMLKDCPTGMELDCNMYDNVSFVKVTNMVDYPIVIKTKSGFSTKLTEYGQNVKIDDAKCVIFPKGKTTWEGFQRPFKDGDVVAVTMIPEGIWIGIFKQYEEKSFESYCYLNTCGEFCSTGSKKHSLKGLHLATEEEKQKLFSVIKANGYKWNPETKTLEKLPKFKVGNRIKYRGGEIVYRIVQITEDSYVLDNISSIPISIEHMYNLVPNKFDITTLKPFDNCKYSLDGGKTWKFAQYWYIHDKYDVNEIEIDLWLN